MMLDFINRFLTVQDGVMGLLFFHSDYFATRSLSRMFFKDAPELDASVCNSFMCIGACLLSDVIFHLFFHMEDHDKVVLALSRIIGGITQLLLFLRVLNMDHSNGYFNETTLVALAVANSYNVIWLARDLFQHYFRGHDWHIITTPKKKTTKEEDAALRSKKIANILALVNSLPWGIVMYLSPQTFGLDGRMSFAVKMGNETDRTLAIRDFVMQLHGAHIISCAPLLLCISWETYQCTYSFVLAMVFYIPCTVRGLLDSTGVVNRNTYLLILFSQVTTTLVVGKLLMSQPQKKKSLDDTAGAKTIVEEIPSLQAENAKKEL